MLKIYFVLFLPFLISLNLKSQNYEFYGVLKLNGKKENSISYRLFFTESNGKVSGYSITDITGEHETKNLVEGTYDAKTKYLKIKEKNIVYTKSVISDELFCFVNFEGKIKLTSEKAKVEGAFKGLFKNNKKCIDGTLELIGTATVNKLLQKVNKKIQKSKELDEASKKKYNPIQIFDSLQTQQLTASQNLNIFTNSKQISFEIWDNGVEDGDIINLYHNNKLCLNNYKVTLEKKKIVINLSDLQNEFVIEAINQGSQGLNTAMMTVEGDKSVVFQSNLIKGETTKVTIINEK
jgi:hypothetical protein